MRQRARPDRHGAITQAHTIALHMADDKLRGEAWHLLGSIAAQLPAEALPLELHHREVRAGDCFQESLRLLRRVGAGTMATYREQITVLRSWAAYETTQGNIRRSETMSREADALADFLAEAGEMV